MDVTEDQRGFWLFNDAGAAFHLLSSLFHTGGPAKRSRASFKPTLFEKLAVGRPVAQHSLLPHARSNVHGPRTHCTTTNICSGPVPRVTPVLAYKPR